MSQTIMMNRRALRAKAGAAYLGIAESTFWRWVSEGRLPKGARLSARATVWKVEDLERFLNEASEGAA